MTLDDSADKYSQPVEHKERLTYSGWAHITNRSCLALLVSLYAPELFIYIFSLHNTVFIRVYNIHGECAPLNDDYSKC